MNFFDLHIDSPYESYKRKESFKSGDLAVTAEKGSVFDLFSALCAIWIPDEIQNPISRYKAVLEHWKREVTIARKREDLGQKSAFFLSLEGASLIDCCEDVDMLYSDGIRAITLTWNGQNKIAGGVNSAGEFTAFGRRVLERINDRGIATDLSHLNDRSFYPVLEAAKYPFASHTACRDVHHVRRNLTDEQIKLIAKREGVIGLCLYPRFLGEGDPFSSFYSHVSHLLFMGLENNIAIGSDFDGAKMDKRLDSADKMDILYYYLKNKGLKGETLEKLFYKNAHNFFAQVLT